MTSSISSSVFLEAVKRSGLISPERLQRLVSDFERDGVDPLDPYALSTQFVRGGYLTPWQTDKLLKGKHRGFFLGKYRLLSLLGKGGMSSVYLAEHMIMRRRCAIKVLPTKLVRDASHLERFYREAQAVASLDHRNIVRAYDVDRVDDEGAEIHFLVMEYVEGQSLQDMVRNNGPVGCVECAEYLRQAAEGLAHAHRAGLIHRDVKPANLLIDRNGVVKILDLGLARYFYEGDEASITVHRGEGLLGTVDYLAPEQAIDSHAVDFRADLYGLGCSGYFALTGHAPFHVGTVPERILSHQTKEVPAISAERADVPASLVAIMNRMLQKKPDDRYQTADEVAEACSAWLAEHERATAAAPPAVGTGVVAPVADTTVAEPGADTSVAQPPPVAATSVAASTAVAAAAPSSKASESGVPSSQGADVAEVVVESAAPVASPEPGESPPWAGVAPAEFPDFSALEKPSAALEKPAEPAPPPRAVARPATSRAPDSLDFTLPAPAFESEVPVAEMADVAESAPMAAEIVSEGTPPALFDMGATPISPSVPRVRLASRRRRVPIALVAVVGLVAVAGAGFAVWKFGFDKKEAAAQGANSGTGAKQAAADSAAKAKSAAAPKFLGRQIRVGPGADLPTITAALEYVRANKDSYPATSRKDTITILVASGKTLTDRIELDNSDLSYPSTQIRIASDGEALAVLAPTGPKPVISLKKAERVRIDGFEIKGDGKSIAVELTDCGQATRLTRLHINGFAQAGIRATGLAGLGSTDGNVSFERLEIRGEDSKAAGIRFDGDARYVQLQNSRFFGPLSAGVVFDGNCGFIRVQETIFSGLGDGIRCTGGNRTWADVAITNNTFHKVSRGIVFAEMLMSSSSDLVIARNLFAGLEGPEAVVEKGYVADTFFGFSANVGVGGNWSDRSAAPDPSKGEHRVIQHDEERLAKRFEFVTEDPKDPKFLAPPANSPVSHLDRRHKNVKPYAGAVAP